MYSISRNDMLLLITLAAGLTLACGEAPENEVETTPATEQSAKMPPGHPSAGQGAAVPSPLAGSDSTNLVWDTPGAWVEETPSSGMRRAQYRVPGEAGDGECVVFYFGPGQGGEAQENAERWAQMFEQPDGRASTEVMSTRMLNVNGISIMLVEVSGTYHAGSMTGGASEARPDHLLLGAIAEGPDANWFFKLTGPEATVKANQEAFEKMLQSLQIRG